MTITPVRVNFIGGDNIYVSGPCFKFSNTYKMKFDDDQITNCTVIDTTKSVCSVPFLKRIGKVPIKMSINGDFTFEAFVVSKDVSLNPEIKGIKTVYEVNQLTDIVTLTVDSVQSNVERQSVTYSVIFAYIDRLTGLKKSAVLKDNEKKKIIQIDLSLVKKQVKMSQNTVVFGFIYVAETTKIYNYYNLAVNVSTNIAINSIYIYLRNENNFGLCKDWYSEQPNSDSTLNGLPACWRQLSLDFNRNFPIAFGDFSQDNLCNPSNPESCDFFHPGAEVCYQSVSSFNGAGQECCYTSNNSLLVGQPGGGSLNIIHSNDVWNHFIRDVEPYLLCCILSDQCNLYYEKRPSDDGGRWTAPRVGGASGDPHLSTLDGLGYTYNGYGEFILVEIEEIHFLIQVRMTPFINPQTNQVTQATVISSLAVQYQQGTIQLEITRLGQVEILLNGRFLESQDETIFALDGLNLYLSPENYILQFENEINIDIILTEEHNAFSIITTLPDRFQNKTKGLLGIMDGNIANDFSLPNGTVLQLNASNDRDIFYKFGEHWRNTPSNSIFTYSDGFNHSDYANKTFVPRFIADGIVFSNREVEILAREQCQDNLNCLFDISLTGQISIGVSNIVFNNAINQFQETVETNLVTCVLLNSIFENGNLNTTILTHGYEYEFNCNPTYCLNGERIIRCENATYNFDPPVCLPCPTTPTTATTVAPITTTTAEVPVTTTTTVAPVTTTTTVVHVTTTTTVVPGTTATTDAPVTTKTTTVAPVTTTTTVVPITTTTTVASVTTATEKVVQSTNEASTTTTPNDHRKGCKHP